MSKRTISVVIAIPAWTHQESHPTALRKLGAGFWPPLNMMYLASRLQADGHRVAILDGGFYTHEGLIRAIASHDPDLVGIYSNTVLWNGSRLTAEDVRAVLPHAHITFGGPLPSVIRKEHLEKCEYKTCPRKCRVAKPKCPNHILINTIKPVYKCISQKTINNRPIGVKTRCFGSSKQCFAIGDLCQLSKSRRLEKDHFREA